MYGSQFVKEGEQRKSIGAALRKELRRPFAAIKHDFHVGGNRPRGGLGEAKEKRFFNKQ